jgi:polar amino acid transport system permease protein
LVIFKRKITLLDLVLLAMLAASGVYLSYRVKVGLNYNWNWSVLPQFLFRFDQESARWVPNLLMQGFFNTVRLSIWGTLLASLIGLLMGLWRVSHSLFYRLIGRSYVEICRNLPPLVLIFIFYFFVSDQIMPILGVEDFVRNSSPATQSLLTFCLAPPDLIAPFLSALITLAIFEGAYITEIVRAGIQSIERGQWEAGRALGMGRWQLMRHIILPQAIKRILPPLGGQFISTIKDSAIVSVISIQELTFQGMELMSATFMTFEVWITVTLLYLLLTLTCSLALARLETVLHRRER